MGDLRLEGKVALVTGAGGAICGAIARRFSAEGASVCVADINEENATKTVRDIEQAKGKAISCSLDVSDPRQTEHAVQLTSDRFGGLHILVNGAAIATTDGTVVDLSLEDWNRELGVNLTGVFLMCKYAIPLMAKSGGGSIVNIASQFGRIGVPKRPTYCSSKGAIIQLTKVMAIDHAKDNIRVNSISPGAIDTPRSLWRYGTREEANRIRGRYYLMGRTGSVQEIASAALFLASDESSFSTGTDLLVDGGFMSFKGSLEDIKN